MALGRDGNTEYADHGLELSIHLGYIIEGYRSVRQRTPAFNYLLCHAAMGITIVVMQILCMINQKWRKKHCIPFFVFSILEGIHAIPASIINDSPFLVALFSTACALLISLGVWGIYTKLTCDEAHPEKAERHFTIQYTVITTINAFAAVLETPNIFNAFKDKDSITGEFLVRGEVHPHPMVGNTFYDKFDEKFGQVFFFSFISIVWFIWPICILQIKGEGAPAASKKVHEN